MNPKRLRAQFRSLVKAVFSRRPSCLVQRIPTELLDIIFGFLPIQDQICLALSCKSLYLYFRSLLRDENLQLSQLLPSAPRPILCTKTDVRKNGRRIQLVQRLENRNWKYCSGCWKLHRRPAWITLDWRDLSQKPLCRAFACKVDICPCMTITFKDMQDLIGTIKATKRSEDTPKVYFNGNAYRPRKKGFYPAFQHDCVYTDHPFAYVKIATMFSWDDKDEFLEVRSYYTIQILTERFLQTPDSLGIKTPLICPHKNLREWLKRFYAEAGSNFSGWHRGITFGKSSCNCRKTELGDSPQFFKTSIGRILGGDKRPNGIWK
ncbi:hypothetical protein BGW36DRAFT_48401 [Talaromyces proteolyticus]|uniref:F-box domain-containing protein n=1 Tax=Talaromyces proteolyticus TaxID=1131652 RepID=A0AAD4PVC2_9EURO|nr:uncharacterized protein BGW36DRAFT_48401 [Talaromyces proteolyticus]KAH8691193.1 hypothetical protein BGW36DRAFT_48401 [Talaromyces proteolyticus]